jgi:glycosyltransferase involved in cell wall biosynthesis
MSRLDFPANLHIAGDGPDKDKLERLTRESGIADQVVFHGWASREKVFDLLLNSQLFVHAPRWIEYFCISQLEAMALGVPMVVSDCGGMASAMKDVALTFRRADIDDLAEKIKLIHDNPALATDLTEKAEEKVKDFDYSHVGAKYLEVYKDITGTAGSE